MSFFKPAWASKNEKRALKAVAKVTDKNELIRIVDDAPRMAASKAAIYKMTDQGILIDIFEKSKSSILRRAIAEKITDQNFLADIVKTCVDNDVCNAAFLNLNSQEALADVACFTAGQKSSCEKAIKLLTDQNVLAEIADSDDDNYIYIWEEIIETPIYTGASCPCPQGSGYGCNGDPGSCIMNYPAYYESHIEEHTLDLREAAQKRLAELLRLEAP